MITMKWSKVKVLAEDLLCESLRGRVHYQAIVHRKSHDQTGSFRVTLDKVEIFRASDIPYTRAVNIRGNELQSEREITFPWHLPWQEWKESEDYQAYHRTYNDAEIEIENQDLFPAWEINRLLFDYIHMPFEEAVAHQHPFIRALSLFDRRFGKRRLAAIDIEQVSGLVKAFYTIRVEAEFKSR